MESRKVTLPHRQRTREMGNGKRFQRFEHAAQSLGAIATSPQALPNTVEALPPYTLVRQLRTPHVRSVRV